MNLVPKTGAPMFLCEHVASDLIKAVQDHSPAHVRVLRITMNYDVLRDDRRVVITIQRDGDPSPISFWATPTPSPGFHWFPMQAVIAKIGLLA